MDWEILLVSSTQIGEIGFMISSLMDGLLSGLGSNDCITSRGPDRVKKLHDAGRLVALLKKKVKKKKTRKRLRVSNALRNKFNKHSANEN